MNLMTGVSGRLNGGRLWRSQAWAQPATLQSKPWLQSTAGPSTAVSGYWADIGSNHRSHESRQLDELHSPDLLDGFALTPSPDIISAQAPIGGAVKQQSEGCADKMASFSCVQTVGDNRYNTNEAVVDVVTERRDSNTYVGFYLKPDKDSTHACTTVHTQTRTLSLQIVQG